MGLRPRGQQPSQPDIAATALSTANSQSLQADTMTALTADAFFQAQFYVLAAATVCLTAWSRYSDRGDGSKSAGAALARTYLPVYALIMTSDWLQGPYMYRLLSVNHGYKPSGIAALFVVGFLSAAVASPVVGRWADM